MSRYDDDDGDWGGYRGYGYGEPRRLIRPANGIRAKSQRGPFGTSWWAGRWIAALEGLVHAGRLQRGRTYARNGQVVSMDVSTEGVTAKVQGSSRTPYSVQIRFKGFDDQVWGRVIEAMSEQALFAAKLLNGEMPNEIEAVFAAAGVSLFPDRPGDLITDCTCLDYANPCKHTAAIHYLLGERFDDDPFLVFLLRGRSKEQIVAALRALRTGSAGDAAEEPAAAEADEAPPLATNPAVFWASPADLDAIALPYTTPAVAALAFKGRGTPPFYDGSLDLPTAMERTYGAISAQVRAIVEGDGTSG